MKESHHPSSNPSITYSHTRTHTQVMFEMFNENVEERILSSNNGRCEFCEEVLRSLLEQQSLTLQLSFSGPLDITIKLSKLFFFVQLANTRRSISDLLRSPGLFPPFSTDSIKLYTYTAQIVESVEIKSNPTHARRLPQWVCHGATPTSHRPGACSVNRKVFVYNKPIGRY